MLKDRNCCNLNRRAISRDSERDFGEKGARQGTQKWRDQQRGSDSHSKYFIYSNKDQIS